LKYFLLVRISEQLAISLENRVALKIFTVLKYFLSFRIFDQLALALKNRAALKFFTVLKYFLSFRIFDQLALALKTEFALKYFTTRRVAAPRPPASYAYGRDRNVPISERPDQSVP